MAQDQGRVTNEEAQQPVVTNLQMQALVGEMRRMMRAELEPIHERLDRVEEGTPQRQQQNVHNVQRGEYFGEDFDEENDRESIDNHRRYGGRGREVRFREARNREDNNLGSIKMKIPSFQGKTDPSKKHGLIFSVEVCFQLPQNSRPELINAQKEAWKED